MSVSYPKTHSLLAGSWQNGWHGGNVANPRCRNPGSFSLSRGLADLRNSHVNAHARGCGRVVGQFRATPLNRSGRQRREKLDCCIRDLGGNDLGA